MIIFRIFGLDVANAATILSNLRGYFLIFCRSGSSNLRIQILITSHLKVEFANFQWFSSVALDILMGKHAPRCLVSNVAWWVKKTNPRKSVFYWQKFGNILTFIRGFGYIWGREYKVTRRPCLAAQRVLNNISIRHLLIPNALCKLWLSSPPGNDVPPRPLPPPASCQPPPFRGIYNGPNTDQVGYSEHASNFTTYRSHERWRHLQPSRHTAPACRRVAEKIAILYEIAKLAYCRLRLKSFCNLAKNWQNQQLTSNLLENLTKFYN